MSKDSSLANLELNPNDADVLIRFVGELNENIKQSLPLILALSLIHI